MVGWKKLLTRWKTCNNSQLDRNVRGDLSPLPAMILSHISAAHRAPPVASEGLVFLDSLAPFAPPFAPSVVQLATCVRASRI